jgi:hypothetical protein
MDTAVDTPTLELLAWIGSRRRTYAEAIEVWRSHCPRHAVWDDALTGGLVRVVRGNGRSPRAEVALTSRGLAALSARA